MYLIQVNTFNFCLLIHYGWMEHVIANKIIFPSLLVKLK